MALVLVKLIPASLWEFTPPMAMRGAVPSGVSICVIQTPSNNKLKLDAFFQRDKPTHPKPRPRAPARNALPSLI